MGINTLHFLFADAEFAEEDSPPTSEARQGQEDHTQDGSADDFPPEGRGQARWPRLLRVAFAIPRLAATWRVHYLAGEARRRFRSQG